MNKNPVTHAPALPLGIISAILLTCGLSARAATLGWVGTGTTANWSEAANWTNSLGAHVVPASGDTLIFPEPTQTANVNDLSGLAAGALAFTTGGFDLSGNSLAVSNGITSSSGNNTIEFPVTLSLAQTFLVDGGTLAFNGTLTNMGDLTIAGTGEVTWTYVPNTASVLQGLMGPGNLIVNGNVTVNGGFVYPVNGNNFAGSTIVNNGGVLTMSAGCFDANSLVGQALTINPGGTVHTTQPHIAGASGRPLSIYAGTLDMGSEAYFTSVTLSNATLTTGTTKDLRGNGTFTNLASAYTTSFGVSLSLTSPRTVGVALGTADPAIDFSGNGTVAIQGAGNLTKVGLGKMRVSAPDTHTGTTVISEGTLILTSTMASTPSITVAANAVFDVSAAAFSLSANQSLSGSGKVIGSVQDQNAGTTISPGGDAAVGTLIIETLGLQGNATLNFDLSGSTTTGGGVNDLLIVTNFALSTGSTNTVNFSFAGTPAAGAYTLIQYPSGQGPAAGPVTTLAAAASRYTYTFTSTGTSIQVTVVANPAPLVWRGDGVTNTWDLGITTNWMNGAKKDVFFAGDNATFDDTGSSTPPVNLVGALSANIVTVGATKDYTFGGSGKLSGGSRLVKTNSGNLTILTANDNSGGGSLIGPGVINVGNGGPTGALGTGNLTNNTKVTFFLNAAGTYGGNMSGTGGVFSFMPATTLTLTGTNTYTGGTTISNGTFQIGNATPGSSVAGNITNYGTLNLYRSDAFTNQNIITSAGNSYEYGTGSINVRGVGGMTEDGAAPISIGGDFSVGQSASGLLTVNPGGLINMGGSFLLGNPNNAAYYGIVNQNGGTINVSNQVRIGHWASEISLYNLSGGTLNVPNNQLAVGWDGIGVMKMTAGTITCRTLNVDDNGATAAISGTNSTFTMTGGLLSIGTGGIGGNTATINLAGGTVAAAAPAGFSSAMAMILSNGTPTLDSSNSVITLSGVLSGPSGLTKQGSGYLNLNGANTFTGTATVANGTLEGTGTVAGPVTVQSGASLSAGGALATGTLTLSNVSLSSGAGMTFDLSSTAATSDQIVAKGTLALDSAGTPATFNFLGGVPFTGGPYTIITNWVPRTGHLVLAPSAPSGLTRYAATLDETNPNRVQVSFSGANANLVWKGNVNNRWDVNADANWLNGGTPDKYYQSDAVVFDGTGISTPNVVLASNMTPASVTVNASGNYSFAGGDLAGFGTLTKSGSGSLVISNNVNLLGITTVGGGTLQIGNGGTSGFIAGNISDYGSVVFNRSDTVAYGINPVNAGTSVITGPGSLTQAGSGTLLILATMNHYGGTTINPGSTVQLGNGALVDSGSLGNSPAINNGTLKFYRLSSIAVGTPLAGNGNFNFLGTGNSAQSAYSLNATNTFTGPVTLSYARIQSGAGALSFGSPSSITVPPASQVYAVATPSSSVYNLPLTLAGTGWQDGLGALRIENAGTWAGPITLSANARIGVNNASTNTITGNITGNYELETYGGNALASLVLAPSSANTFSALRVSIGTAGSSTVAGNANAIPNNIPLTMNGGTLKLNGFGKSFSPFYNVGTASSIQNGSTTSPVTVNLTPAPGATVSWGGTFADGGPQPLNVTLNRTIPAWTMTLSTASPNWTGNFTNNGGTITSGTQNTPFGSQGVPGRFIVGLNGAVFMTTINNALAGYSGNLILSNSTWICNRYISFAPNAGYVFLANSMLTGTNSSDGAYQNWQLPSTVVVRGNAPSYFLGYGTSPAYDLQPTGTTFDVADTTGNANADLIVGGGSSTTYIRNQANSSTACQLIKTGAGTMELDGPNTYSGPTVINNGVLAIGASSTISGSPSLTVAAGAKLDVSAQAGGWSFAGQTLSGAGAVVGNAADGAASVISPGPSPATLSFSNSLTLGGSGSVIFNLSTNNTVGANVNDLIVVGGTLTLTPGTPTPVIFNFPNGAPAQGVPYRLFQCGGISGTVATAFSSSGRYASTFSQVANNVVVTFTGSPTNLVWTGSDPTTPDTWDVATSTNWSGSMGATLYYQGDTVKFDDTSTHNSVTLGTTVYPGGIVVDSTNNYTVSGSGAIAGITGITKNNTNTFTLGTVNTFAGPIKINAGRLTLGVNDALPPGSTVTVAPKAAFDFTDNNGNTTTRGYSFIISGAGPDGSGAMVDSVDGGGIYSYACVSNLTLMADSVIGGIERWDIGSDPNSKLDGQGHSLTIVGTGNGAIDIRSQILTNVASIIVSNPVTWYENYDQTNAWTAATTNFVAPGSSLGIYGAKAVNMPVVLNGATIRNQGGGNPAQWTGRIVVSNTSAFDISGSQFFSGIVSGAGGINVDGGRSTLTFSNANSYQGGTIISNGPSTTSAVDATAGSAAVVAGSPNAFGTGTVTINGQSFSSLATNTSFFLTNVFRAVEFAFAAPGTVPNNIVLPATPISNVSLHGRDSGQAINLTGQISGGFSGMTNWVDFGDANAVGVMRYANNANNFIGTVTVFRGLLGITGDGALGNSANLLRLNSGGGLRFDGPAVNLAHNTLLTLSTTLNVYGDNTGDGIPETANNATISGVINSVASSGFTLSVTGGTNISGTSSGSLTLSGANTFDGNVSVLANTKLIAASPAALGAVGGTTYFATANNGATLSLNLNGTYTANRQLQLAGSGVLSGGVGVGALENLSGANIYPAAMTLTAPTTIGITAGSLTLNGVISGSFPLTKIGSGPLTLNANETYNAGTFLNAGTLFLNGSLPVGNAVNVGSATLAGNGTINGPVTIGPGGALEPGVGAIGRLAVNSTLALAGTTTLEINGASGTNDAVVGLSTVTYGGTLNVNNLGGVPAANAKFTLFSAVDRAGSFSAVNLPNIAPLTWNNLLSVDGSIVAVSSSVSITPVYVTNSVSGTNLVLTWPADHTGWQLLVQTNNLNAGISTNNANWGVVPGSTTTNQVWIPIDTAKPSDFYRLHYSY